VVDTSTTENNVITAEDVKGSDRVRKVVITDAARPSRSKALTAAST
jgi:hypothetical protein